MVRMDKWQPRLQQPTPFLKIWVLPTAALLSQARRARTNKRHTSAVFPLCVGNTLPLRLVASSRHPPILPNETKDAVCT